MTESQSTEISCVLCDRSFEPVLGPKPEQSGYGIYCDTCTLCIFMKSGDPVRTTCRKVMDLEGRALALALESVLIDCPCGGTFQHDAGKRCEPCLDKIYEEVKSQEAPKIPGIWNVEKLKEWEPKILAYILEKSETQEETLTTLIEKFDAGEIGDEEYMQGMEEIRSREFVQVSAIQTWAMIQGPQLAFRAAEDLELVERYGSRILISIAMALEMSTGQSVLNSLMREANNWDGPIQRELKTYIAKTAGGF